MALFASGSGLLAATGNYMLDSFSNELKSSLLRIAEQVALPLQTMFFSTENNPAHVYFLTSGLASIVVSMRDGRTAEVAMCGKEGLVGGYSLLGLQHSSASAFMQIPGEGLRISRRAAESLFESSAEFRNRVLAFVQASMHVSLQTSACGLLHEAEERLARWLLMSADRTGSDQLPLTQDYLAQMLGTQRTTLVLVAGELRKKGLIDYMRGRVTIMDRAGLVAAACECYEVSRRAFTPPAR